MFEVLIKYRVHNKSVKAIILLYKYKKSIVFSPDGETDKFHLHL